MWFIDGRRRLSSHRNDVRDTYALRWRTASGSGDSRSGGRSSGTAKGAKLWLWKVNTVLFGSLSLAFGVRGCAYIVPLLTMYFVWPFLEFQRPTTMTLCEIQLSKNSGRKVCVQICLLIEFTATVRPQWSDKFLLLWSEWFPQIGNRS